MRAINFIKFFERAVNLKIFTSREDNLQKVYFWTKLFSDIFDPPTISVRFSSYDKRSQTLKFSFIDIRVAIANMRAFYLKIVYTRAISFIKFF